MKNTYLLILAVAILGVSALYLLQKDTGASSTITSSDKDFSIKNFDEIYKIFLADRNGKKILLERTADQKWLLNGKFDVRDDAVLMLRQVMSHVEIRTIPTNSATQRIVSDLATLGIKVEAYNQNGEKVKSYYVGGSTKDEMGTYMIMENAEQPYVTHIAMLPGGLRARYMLGEENWKDTRFFKESVENIKMVTVEYPSMPSKSFLLQHDLSTFTVQPLKSTLPKSPNSIKRGIAEKYLDQFKNIGAEAFRNDMPEKDSILRSVPFAIVTVKNLQDKEISIKLYPIPMEDLTTEQKEAKLQATIERYFGSCSNGEFYLLQQVVVGKVLWSYDSFFEENKLN
jgi:hypothetical protein